MPSGKPLALTSRGNMAISFTQKTLCPFALQDVEHVLALNMCLVMDIRIIFGRICSSCTEIDAVFPSIKYEACYSSQQRDIHLPRTARTHAGYRLLLRKKARDQWKECAPPRLRGSLRIFVALQRVIKEHPRLHATPCLKRNWLGAQLEHSRRNSEEGENCTKAAALHKISVSEYCVLTKHLLFSHLHPCIHSDIIIPILFPHLSSFESSWVPPSVPCLHLAM
ncbi:hypothetical protein PoB_006438800 [Plakobranchus ocellatus]|uniref:Uncharacterized protein n=1 Tax=Plakobranchus ocellatus TaxID=259542 RepID=A0AAV4D1G4_9GAST|nr:hypothetical protein PoB_006438800 [Plakobranchus ocellatus]